MTAKRADIGELPNWPRLLSREQAAAYVGLSPNQFIEEVENGAFPQAVRLLSVTRRALWDRLELDAVISAQSRILGAGENSYEARKAAWQRRIQAR